MFSSSTSEVQAQAVQTTDELIVYGTVVTRNRSDTVAPVSPTTEYFQRFEPISAGDALKRVPGVSFSGDVLEYDRLQLRGLPAIYAQVQINGQLQRGGGSDSVFAVTASRQSLSTASRSFAARRQTFLRIKSLVRQILS